MLGSPTLAWAQAEGLQTHLRRTGIRTTAHFDTPVRTAWLEVWPGLERRLVHQAGFVEGHPARVVGDERQAVDR